MTPFPCNRCGACCRNVHLAEATHFLDRGDGCCKHYDDTSQLCSIYQERPSICRIDEQFEVNYKLSMTWEIFVELNLAACAKLNEETPQLKP